MSILDWRGLGLALAIFMEPSLTLEAATAGERQLYLGEASIADEPPIPIHLEVQRDQQRLVGLVTTHGGVFHIEADGAGPVVEGDLTGEGVAGRIRLNLRADGGEGEFDLGGAPGVLTLNPTVIDARAFLRGPEQTLDLPPQDWAADLDRLVEIITTEHGSPFHRVDQARFEAEVARIRAGIPASTGPQVAAEFRALAAMIGDGHTSVGLAQGRPRLPLRFFWFHDGLVLVEAPEALSAHLGSHVAAINGRPAELVLRDLERFIGTGETESGLRAAIPFLAARSDLLDAVGAWREGPQVLTLRGSDGASSDVALAVSGSGPRASLGGRAPLWERSSGESFLWSWVQPDAVYVNWRGYDGLDAASARLLEELDDRRPAKVIIDLRDNAGGDYTVGRRFIEALRSRPWLDRDGVLYVLIGRTTFSAAMTNAVDFHLTTNATLVGEPAGARPNNWQESRHFTLPHSGLPVTVSTRYYAFLPGDGAELRPDISAPPVAEDWGSDLDTAVSLILSER